MNLNNLNQNEEINKQNVNDAWANFVKSGKIEDYHRYFECKRFFMTAHRGADDCVHSSEWFGSGRE